MKPKNQKIADILARVNVETRKPELIDMVRELEIELLAIAEMHPYVAFVEPDKDLDTYKDRLHWGIGVCNSKLRR